MAPRKITLDTPDSQQRLAAVLEILNDCDAPEYHKILNAAAQTRPWRPKRTGWTNVLDQLLHAVYGAMLLSPVLFVGSYLGAGLMGFLAGGVREVEQYFNQDMRIKMFWDRVLDTSAFIVGALLLFHFFQ